MCIRDRLEAEIAAVLTKGFAVVDERNEENGGSERDTLSVCVRVR